VYAQAARKHGIIDQPNPSMSVTSETIVEVIPRGNDPRLGYSTPYYWREQPGMQRYYELQTEIPTLPGAERFGINFANESERERDRQLHMVGPRPFMRSRYRPTQTRPLRERVSDAAIQFRTPALDAEAQIRISANDVATQTDHQIGFDNFGLPPGLTVDREGQIWNG